MPSSLGNKASRVNLLNQIFFLSCWAKSQLRIGAQYFFLLHSWNVRATRLSSKNEMLYVIGLGLSDEKDITVRGLEAVKSCERVYLEAYTSILMVDSSKLVSLVSEYFSVLQIYVTTISKFSTIWIQSEYYGKQVIVADREMVESESDAILADADKINVAFLVVGDPYG